MRNISITVTDTDKKKEIYSDFGELLFTHFGLSGPVILSASAHMRGMRAGRYRIDIDCKPALSFEQLDKRLLRDFEKNKNRDFCNSLSELLPRTMIPVMVMRSGIRPETKCNAITKNSAMPSAGCLSNSLLLSTASARLKRLSLPQAAST